jgi:HEAT repeat protein
MFCARARLRAWTGLGLAAACLGASLSLPSAALAKKKAPAAAPAQQSGLSLEEISLMLSSGSADEVKMAIESSALLNSPAVVPILIDRVRAGLPPDLLSDAIEALVLLNQPQANPLFVELSRHRRPSVRLRSVQALAALRARDAEPALVRALGDSSPEVREAAAEGLGQLSASGSLDVLFAAFDRGVLGAGRAIGKLVGDAQVPRVLQSLGRVPLSSLSPVFDALLARNDIGEATKLSIVAALSELGTNEARAYLDGLRPQLPQDASPRVRKAIDDAVARIAK